ncbi:F-box domain containing protein [Trema orientale]|uniref:F-box domain containing protein n=1 Tax=Trema orientale TaxID=63057 RepID=A0A2P5EMT5_TREOI|nr:F-box domain containing protein [Trema orientale]
MSESLKTISIDRFTSLPEDVAHRVVTFLSMEHVSRLSVVSRRCRQLCVSSPVLEVIDVPYRTNATKRTQLMNYVDRLLLLRRGMSIRRFIIVWCLETSLGINGAEEEYRVLSWLHNGFICNFKELKLLLSLNSGYFTVPPSLLRSMSLESLTVCILYGLVKFPSCSSTGFSSLKYLHLTCVRIDESFGNWISTCCKLLKTLHLGQIKETKSIVINSSSITELDIASTDHELCRLQVSAGLLERMTLWWEFDSSNDRALQLSIPKVQMFFWKGNILRLPITENLSGLKSAGSILFPSASTLTSQNIVRLYCDFSHLSSPNLFDTDLCVLSVQGRLPILVTSLLAIHILTTSICIDLVQLVASLFEGSSTPYRYLYIWNKILLSHTEAIERDHKSMKCSDAQNETIFMQNLKFVTIELISQGKNELEMIKYLLKNVKYLQMITILYASPLGSDVVGEIRGHERASADVVVNFHPM